VLLLGLFAVPLAAVIWRSINPDFFRNAFSEQALDALSLSLTTTRLPCLWRPYLARPGLYSVTLELQA
jgi:hypothetical protein